MAILSNINDLFRVDDTGAIFFGTTASPNGFVLKSNGTAASPTWVDPNTVGTGPWLPLAGGAITNNLTIGGTLGVTGAATVGGVLTGATLSVTGAATLSSTIAVASGRFIVAQTIINPVTITGTVGPDDNIRGSLIVRDDTAMAVNVGGQIALGYKYLNSGGYTEGALIRTYKLNAISDDYSSGIKWQVRNTGANLSTKMTLDPSGNLTTVGNMYAIGGNSSEWNNAYDNSITGLAVTGTTTKTLTATQQDGGTLTATWTDNDNNTSWPNVGAGIRTNYTLGFKPPTNAYAGFYFQTEAAAGGGYLLMRGAASSSGAYTNNGISLIADAGWLTLASRTTTDTGVRLMSGSTSAERLVIKDNGESYFTGNLGIGVTSVTGNGGLEVTNTGGTFANANQKRVASFYDGSVNSERPGIILGYDDSSTPHGIIAARTQSGTSTIPGIQFFTYNGSSWSAKMTILSGGNVGIGLVNPSAQFHNYSTATTNVFMTGYGTATNNDWGAQNCMFVKTDNGLLISKQNAANNTNRLFNFYNDGNGYAQFYMYTGGSTPQVQIKTSGYSYFNGGNVGIGLTSPAARLDVLQETRISFAQGNQYRTRITNTDGNTRILSDGQQCNIIFGTTGLVNNGTASEVMRLNWQGYLGIGTTSPLSKLQIIANQAATDPGGKNFTGSAINADGGDIATGRVFFQGNNSTAVDLCGINNETNRIVLFNYTDGRYLQYWDHAGSSFIPNGNLSVGSTQNGANNEKLFVDGTVRQQSTIGLNTNGSVRQCLGAYDNTTGWAAGIGGQLALGYIYTGTSYTEGALIKMYKENSAQGHYGSGLRWAVRENGTNLTAKMQLSPSGTLTVKGDVIAYGSPSDISLKENIKPISNSLDKVKKLQGVTFDWIQKEDQILDIKEDIGFIAQDVEKVIPELVRKNKDGLLSMRHQGIIPMLVEAIKELEARVKELEIK